MIPSFVFSRLSTVLRRSRRNVHLRLRKAWRAWSTISLLDTRTSVFFEFFWRSRPFLLAWARGLSGVSQMREIWATDVFCVGGAAAVFFRTSNGTAATLRKRCEVLCRFVLKWLPTNRRAVELVSNEFFFCACRGATSETLGGKNEVVDGFEGGSTGSRGAGGSAMTARERFLPPRTVGARGASSSFSASADNSKD